MEDQIEIWREIPGYEGLYSISNMARVRRDSSYKQYGKDLIKNHIKNFHGYYHVVLSKKAVHKTFRVHHLMAMCFMGHREKGIEVNHMDGDKSNNRLSNLEFVTRKQNIQHAMHMGLVPKGERHSNSKLTDEYVREIRKKYLSGMSIVSMSLEYGVSAKAISCVVNNKTWCHVK